MRRAWGLRNEYTPLFFGEVEDGHGARAGVGADDRADTHVGAMDNRHAREKSVQLCGDGKGFALAVGVVDVDATARGGLGGYYHLCHDAMGIFAAADFFEAVQRALCAEMHDWNYAEHAAEAVCYPADTAATAEIQEIVHCEKVDDVVPVCAREAEQVVYGSSGVFELGELANE